MQWEGKRVLSKWKVISSRVIAFVFERRLKNISSLYFVKSFKTDLKSLFLGVGKSKWSMILIYSRNSREWRTIKLSSILIVHHQCKRFCSDRSFEFTSFSMIFMFFYFAFSVVRRSKPNLTVLRESLLIGLFHYVSLVFSAFKWLSEHHSFNFSISFY